jgi:uncharacterized protein
MSRIVFWDASAFIALSNNRDSMHQKALSTSANLANEKARILTTSAVLTEVANWLSKIGSRRLAQDIIVYTRQSSEKGLADIIHVDEELWQRGWQLFQDRLDKEWGLTDCISFVIMTDYKVTEAFTADKHFEQAGFIRLLQT